MKLVMVLSPGGDRDIADAHLAFHLNAGVDLVLIPAEAGAAGLERWERSQQLVRHPSAGPDARTHLARLAATEHGADWVIIAESHEFWWPRGESLKDVLVAIPPRYGVVQALVRDFLWRPDDGRQFAERMTIRRSLQAANEPVGPPASLLRALYRADPEIVLGETSGRVPLRAWYPFELLRFPTTEAPQLDDAEIERELAAGRLAVDRRLQAALAELRTADGYALPATGQTRLTLRAPDVVDDAAYAVECAAVGEVDLASLDRHIRELEDRIAWLEERLWPRVLRTASRLVRRGRA
jgi:hypothetical protein